MGQTQKARSTEFYLALNPITTDAIGGIEYLKIGIEELIRLVDQNVILHDQWTYEQQTRGAIAAWDCGIYNLGGLETMDYFTVGRDFSSDIFSRAQYFAENGY